MFNRLRNVKFNEKRLKFGKFWACRDECDGSVIAGESLVRASPSTCRLGTRLTPAFNLGHSTRPAAGGPGD